VKTGRRFTDAEKDEHLRRIVELIGSRPDGIETMELKGQVSFSRPILRSYLQSLMTLGKVRSTIRRHRQKFPPFGAYDARVYFLAESEVRT
jgi:hypothetical protein